MKSKKIKTSQKSSSNQRLDVCTKKIQKVFERSPVFFSMALGVMFGIIVNVIFISTAWQKYVVQERQDQLEAFAEHNSRIAASNVANYIHSVYERLAFFTKSSSLRSALMHNDTVGFYENNNALKNSFPQAEAIRIFMLDEAKIDLGGDPPLRFSELDIIQKAQRREVIIPEALNVGGGWVINVVVPVPADDQKPVVGTILITLPIEDLYKNLQLGLGDSGRISLFQTFGGKPRLMGAFGEGNIYKAQHMDVPNSPWRVEFTASKRLYSATQIDFTFLLLVGGIGSLVSMSLFAFVGLTIGRRIHNRQLAILQTREKMGRNFEGSESDSSDSYQDILNVRISEEDEDLLGIDDVDTDSVEDDLDIDGMPNHESVLTEKDVPPHIFRSYDIRGIVDSEVNKNLALLVGKALGSEALEKGESALIVARDARLHSPLLVENLIRGIMDAGCNVINVGTVPTPLMYFAAEVLEKTSSGVMVTASHNGAEYNGFKVVMNGHPRTQKSMKAMYEKILSQDFRRGIGQEEKVDIIEQYIETIFSDVALAGDVRIVIDAGNAIAGKIAPRLFEELGCEVIPLYCDLDGSFPNHGPDPSIAENLQDLIRKVQEEKAHLGVAFDGDGDRVAVVTPKGNIIWADRLLMLFAKDILSRNPGADVVFDVKSSRQLNSVISSHGGRPIMWKTGHAPMRAKVAETGALLGGEFSGHIFIKDRWYGFDDGMYAAARLIEIVSLRDETLDEIFGEFPSQCITPEIRIPIEEGEKFTLIQKLIAKGDFSDAKIVSIDGLRVEYPYGWGLVRASNTAAELTLRFEAETEEQIHNLKAMFTREIHKLDNSIQFNW